MKKESREKTVTPQEIIDARPKDPQAVSEYWDNYSDLAEQIYFGGTINTVPFRNRGLVVALRDRMEIHDILRAVRMGSSTYSKTTEEKFSRISHELEKVVYIGRIDQTQ